MNVHCKNCGDGIEQKADLNRINQLGVAGEWICQNCLDEMELLDTVPHFVHSKDCPGYCDYACNKNGFELAEQIKKYLAFPHDGKGLTI